MADQKYCGTGTVNSQKEAIKMAFADGVEKLINTFDVQSWREKVLWNEECDTVFKSYLPVFKGIYKNYAKEKVLPGQKPFMCLEEF